MALIVYGSYAKGDARKNSDVDFMVVDSRFRHIGGKLPEYESVISGEEMSTGYELNGVVLDYLEFADENKDRAFWLELKQWGVVLDGWDTTYNVFYRRRKK
jgi:predicted nucleotidyltransferase